MIFLKNQLTKKEIDIVTKDNWHYSDENNQCQICLKKYKEHKEINRLFILNMFLLRILCNGDLVKIK